MQGCKLLFLFDPTLRRTNCCARYCCRSVYDELMLLKHKNCIYFYFFLTKSAKIVFYQRLRAVIIFKLILQIRFQLHYFVTKRYNFACFVIVMTEIAAVFLVFYR